MDKALPTIFIALAVAAIFVGMWLGWRRRGTRDAGITVPVMLDSPGGRLLRTDVQYVATTHHDRPLDRVVTGGLSFRAHAVLTVFEGGVTIEAPGERPAAIQASALTGAGTATWTIDRTVERDGLVLVSWDAAGDGPGGGSTAALDTYLRAPDAETQQLIIANIQSLISPTSSAAVLPSPNSSPRDSTSNDPGSEA